MFLLGAGHPRTGDGHRLAWWLQCPFPAGAEQAGHGGLESRWDWGGGGHSHDTSPPAAPWTCSCASASRPHS